MALLAGAVAPLTVRAGGPAYVAGVTYFNSGMAGQIVSWPQGRVIYYTDRGNLSALLNSSAADAFVADAFSRWTSIPTAALNVTRGGQLAEDVSGANVARNSDGTITMPADVIPSALDHPVGVVYDANGQVTDALLGLGSGARAACFSNAVIGGPDAFSTDGAIAHALVVINGNCIQSSNDLLESKYRLIRILGTVLGLDWAQLNLNVLTGIPTHPTADDKAGFPLMHALDSPNCVPITLCYPDPDHLKMDDRAAIARLYPMTAANVDQFPGKQIFADNTGRIHGGVFFTDAAGNPAQPMQCVNVVARWIDPGTGQPSGQYAASSVSGFLFAGNAGNSITGRTDATGNRYDRWGSLDPAFEGFFDLSGLEIPNGEATRYQLSVEPLDPDWSQQVGPCDPQQVSPSGSFTPLIVTVTKGGDLAQDILMSGSAQEQEDPHRNDNYWTPLPIPANGAWLGSLTGYGDNDYFWFSARANRTFSVDVLALDETGRTTQVKARPVTGVWLIGDPQEMAPAVATPLVYPGIQAQSTIVSTYDPKNIALTPYKLWVMEGTTIDVPLTARVVTSTGTAVSGLKLNFNLIKGTASLSTTSANTDSSGYAQSNLHVDSLSGEVDVRVCADAGGITCPTFSLFKVAASDLKLLPVAGSGQVLPLGRGFAPLWVRVVDSSTPPNPVYGAAVTFENNLFQLGATPPVQGGGDDNVPTHPAQKVKLGSSQTVLLSDNDGFANILPPNGDGSRALEVDIAVTTGARAFLNYALQSVPAPATTTTSSSPTRAASPALEADGLPSRSAPRPR